jgi:hypothetical protein
VGSGLGNYTISYVNGSLAVNPASLTITANNESKTYGTTSTLAGYTTNGLVNSDSVTSVTLTSPGDLATATVAGGPYAITPSAAVGSGLGNYTISYMNGSLAVNPASLTITASNQTTTYGNTNLGTSAFTSSGLQNGETIGAVTLSTNASISTSGNYNAGTWSITPSAATGGTFSAGNYTIKYDSGTLTIDPAALTVTATGPSVPYGTPLTTGPSTTNFINSATVKGESVTSVTLTPSPVLTTTTPPGTGYSVTPSAALGTGGFEAGNYSITYVPYDGKVGPGNPSFTAYDLLQTNDKINKIIYETLSPYQLSSNSHEPLVYFYHPLTPVDQSAFNGIELDEGAYDFIQNSLELKKLPAPYYGAQ